jgi:undecaprenyl diphosphate synthase
MDEYDYKKKVDLNRLPHHVAIILDGNRRWAKKRGKPQTYGHMKGVAAVRKTVEAATQLGIDYLTLFVFSSENWNRPEYEVNELMGLLLRNIKKEAGTFKENDIRLRIIGDMEQLPANNYREMKKLIDKTAQNKRMTLVLAISYGSRQEILKAVKNIASKVQNKKISKESIDESLFQSHLYTAGIPDPELLIRTSGELRISNFLLWQIADTQLIFLDKYWPDFTKKDFYNAITTYQRSEKVPVNPGPI